MAPNNTITPPSLTAPQTRGAKKATNKMLLATSKEIEEHIAGADIRTDITNVFTARKILNTNGLNLSSAGNTIKQLISAIFEFSLSPALGATHAETLRAIAILLHEVEQTIDTNNLINKISTLIDGSIATMDQKMNNITTITENHTTALEKAVQEVRKQLNVSAEDIGKVVETSLNAHNPTRSEGPRSYASAVKSQPTVLLTKILARGEAQARQILLDRRSVLAPNSLRELTEAQLVAKAELALEQMDKENTKFPENIAILSARKLPHGGVLYELNAPESARWLSIPANRSNFLTHFGHDIVIKDRSYNLLMENVPISFDPFSSSTLAEMERKGGLRPKSIVKARYIKPIARRNTNQRTAHVTLTLNSKVDANQIIRFGLPIAGKKVYGRKLLQEPTRCLKCHAFDKGHIATDCPNEQDTCGTCGKEHRTSNCEVENEELHHCVNCKKDGHAAWSRNCPTFVKKWETHRARNEETRYTYFPTDDPLTWETVNDNPETTADQNLQQPPQSNQAPSSGWKTVHQRRQPHREDQHATKSNRVPLGMQSRLTDEWIGSQPRTTAKPNTPPPTDSSEDNQSTPTTWNASPHPQGDMNSAVDLTGWD